MAHPPKCASLRGPGKMKLDTSCRCNATQRLCVGMKTFRAPHPEVTDDYDTLRPDHPMATATCLATSAFFSAYNSVTESVV